MGEMLSWHRAGQKIACVSVSNAPQLKLGEVYTIDAVDAPAFVGDTVGIRLVEVACSPGYLWFHHWHFRPVRETSIDCFRSLLNPTPERVREMEDAT